MSLYYYYEILVSTTVDLMETHWDMNLRCKGGKL